MIQLMLRFGGYTGFAEIALVIFVLAFLAVVVWVTTRPRRAVDRFARLPLDENTDE